MKNVKKMLVDNKAKIVTALGQDEYDSLLEEVESAGTSITLDDKQVKRIAKSLGWTKKKVNKLVSKGTKTFIKELTGRSVAKTNSLEFSNKVLKKAKVEDLGKAMRDLRAAMIAKMTWGQYVAWIGREYGPAIVAGIVATLAAQYALDLYAQSGAISDADAETLADAESQNLHLAA
jgi:hypothetical protein